MNKALVSLLTLALVGFVTVQAATSFFSDQETSSENTFQAGVLDLKVNDTDNPGVLVDVADLKPGDDYFFDKKLKVVDNPAYVWIMLSDFFNSQGFQTEPEAEEESNTQPTSNLESALIYDISVEENVVLHFDDTKTLSEIIGCWIPLGTLPGGQELTITQSFHLPTTVTNWSQGDQFTFTENFYAAQERNNPDAQPPTASSLWDEQTKTCIPTPTTPSFIISEDSWKASQATESNWFLPEFDDSNWESSTAPSYGTCNFSPINIYIAENGALPMWVNNPVEWGTAYFRKNFFLSNQMSGFIRVVMDDTGDVYVNGNLVLSDSFNTGNELLSGDVTSYLNDGDNVIAIRVSDTAGICQDLQFELALTPYNP